MRIEFHKYHGAGNDFVLVDNRKIGLPAVADALYEHLCDRRFGIGADGFILLQEAQGYDFEMRYYNSDGRLSSMCGNGSRCAVALARHLGFFAADSCRFLAYDGPHLARLEGPEVVVQMNIQAEASPAGTDAWFIHTGSPHHVQVLPSGVNIEAWPVVEQGRAIRNSNAYLPGGTNVNFVLPTGPNQLTLRTYERGVEDETLACGTGVTAAALVYATKLHPQPAPYTIAVQAMGGNLSVTKDADGTVWLKGPAKAVFQGVIDVPQP